MNALAEATEENAHKASGLSDWSMGIVEEMQQLRRLVTHLEEGRYASVPYYPLIIEAHRSSIRMARFALSGLVDLVDLVYWVDLVDLTDLVDVVELTD